LAKELLNTMIIETFIILQQKYRRKIDWGIDLGSGDITMTLVFAMQQI
jgi:hypothetical protein